MTRLSFLLAGLALALCASLTAWHGAVSEAALRLWATAIQTQHLAGGEGLSWREVGQTLPQLVARLTVSLPHASVLWLLVPATILGALLTSWFVTLGRSVDERGAWLLLPALVFVTGPATLRMASDPALPILGLAALLLSLHYLARLERQDDRAEPGLTFALAVLVLSEPNAFYFLMGLGLLLPTAFRGQGSYPVRLFRALRLLALPGATFGLVAASHALLARASFGSVFTLWMEPAHGMVRLDQFHGDAGPRPDLTPLPILVALLVLSTPLALVLGVIATRLRSLQHPVTAVAVVLVPLFALAESHALGHNATPLFWLAMVSGLILTWLTIEPLPPVLRRGALLLMLAMNLGTWVMHGGVWREREAARWRASFARPIESTYSDAADTALLLRRFDRIVLDERVAFPLVALSHHPRSLVSIAGALEGEADGANGFDPEAIVVMNPGLEGGMDDRLHLLLPSLWARGREGYELALDRPGWRVYRRLRGLTTWI